jgi:hypothetical protein
MKILDIVLYSLTMIVMYLLIHDFMYFRKVNNINGLVEGMGKEAEKHLNL